MLLRAIERLLLDTRRDVLVARRQMRRAAGFTTVVIVTLAFGIGANVMMAGVIDQLLFRPPPHVRDPARVVRLVQVTAVPGRRAPVAGVGANYPMLLELQRAAPAFAAVAAVSTRETSLGTGATALPIRAALVSASYFPMLGPHPVVGRFFGPTDDFPHAASAGGPAVAVLSYGLWQRHFGGARQVLGTAIRIGTTTYAVLGVAPPGFRGTDDEPPDVWLPITVPPPSENGGITLDDRGSTWLSIVARLADGATPGLGAEQATTVWRRATAALGSRDAEDRTRVVAAPLVRGRGPDAPPEVRMTVWVGGVASLVLLTACANVANLLLGRAYVRRREIGIRIALGADRGRIVRQLLAESVLLAGVAGAAALALAALGARVLGRWLHVDGSVHAVLNPRMFAFTAAVALGTGVATGLVPALQDGADDLTGALRAGAAGSGTRAARVRWSLVAAQSALCMLLLVGAALFALSLGRVLRLDLGMDVEHTLRAQLDLDGIWAPSAQVAATYDEMIRRVQAVPGVRRAVLAEGDPYREGRAVAIHTPEHDAEYFWSRGRGTYAPVPIETAVDTGYFRTVGATSLRGRDFTSSDTRGGERVVILNAPLADLLFEGREALGQCVILPPRADVHGGPCYRVVGVTHGFWQNSILDRDKLAVFIPLEQRVVRYGLGRPRSMFVSVRRNSAEVAAAVRGAIQGVRADLPAVQVTPIRDLVATQTTPWRLATTVLLLFGAIALVMAAVGLYAVVAFAARQRPPEIAIRLAMGARARDVFGLLATESLGAVGAGLCAGILGAVVLRRWLGPLLFQTSPTDPNVIAAITAVLVGVALGAVAVPVAAAARQDIAGLFRRE